MYSKFILFHNTLVTDYFNSFKSKQNDQVKIKSLKLT